MAAGVRRKGNCERARGHTGGEAGAHTKRMGRGRRRGAAGRPGGSRNSAGQHQLRARPCGTGASLRRCRGAPAIAPPLEALPTVRLAAPKRHAQARGVAVAKLHAPGPAFTTGTAPPCPARRGENFVRGLQALQSRRPARPARSPRPAAHALAKGHAGLRAGGGRGSSLFAARAHENKKKGAPEASWPSGAAFPRPLLAPSGGSAHFWRVRAAPLQKAGHTPIPPAGMDSLLLDGDTAIWGGEDTEAPGEQRMRRNLRRSADLEHGDLRRHRGRNRAPMRSAASPGGGRVASKRRVGEAGVPGGLQAAVDTQAG